VLVATLYGQPAVEAGIEGVRHVTRRLDMDQPPQDIEVLRVQSGLSAQVHQGEQGPAARGAGTVPADRVQCRQDGITVVMQPAEIARLGQVRQALLQIHACHPSRGRPARHPHNAAHEPRCCCRQVHNGRVAGQVRYPFEPRSIAQLLAGQFWAVPLSDGRYACGRVLHVPRKADPEPSLYLNTRIFLAGLMDWSGSGPPTSEAIAGCGILAQGRMHVAAISDTPSVILGRRDLELDGLTGLREVSHRGGGTVWLCQGGQRLRPATADECRTLPVMSVWGRRVMQVLAETRFVHH